MDGEELLGPAQDPDEPRTFRAVTWFERCCLAGMCYRKTPRPRDGAIRVELSAHCVGALPRAHRPRRHRDGRLGRARCHRAVRAAAAGGADMVPSARPRRRPRLSSTTGWCCRSSRPAAPPATSSAPSPACTRSSSAGCSRPRLTPNDFASLQTVVKRLDAFEHHYNEVAKPFEWTFTRRDLADLIARVADHEPRLKLAA